MNDITPESQAALIWDYLKGFHAVHHVAMGIEIGLFERIHEAGDGGIKAEDLAAVLNLHAPYVEVWCRTGYSYGFLEADDDGAFRLAAFMDKLLVDRNDPRNLAPYFLTTAHFVSEDLRAYPEHFRNGSVHRFQDHGHDFSRQVSDITAGFHTVVARKMLAGVPGLKERLEEGARVLDFGCGTGGLMIKIAQAWPMVTCLGVDNDPYGLEQARGNIAQSGFADRVLVEKLTDDGIGYENEFDLVTMFEVLHEITADLRTSIMKDIARALRSRGVLFVLDETYPSDLTSLRDPQYALAVQTQFNEMAWGNVVPTKEEQQSLFSIVGLKEINRQQIGGLFTLLIAQKP
jgi:SAM-dependent methyltransferase